MNLAKPALSATLRTPRAIILCCLFALLGLSPATRPVSADRPAISRRPLEHRDYDVWNTLSSSQLSRDGKWAMYQIDSGKIDGESTLCIRSTTSPTEYRAPHGRAQRFSFDGRYAVFLIPPEKQLVKELTKKKTKPDEMPKAQLQILELASGDVVTIDRVASFQLPEESGGWIGYQMEKPIESNPVNAKKSDVRETYRVTPNGLARPTKKLKLKKRESLQPTAAEEPTSTKTPPTKNELKTAEKESSGVADSDGDDGKDKVEGTTLVLRKLDSGFQQTYPHVTHFVFSKHGTRMAMVTSVKPLESDENSDEAEAKQAPSLSDDGVHLVDLTSLKRTRIIAGAGQYKNLAFNEDGTRLAFLTNKDDNDAKSPRWSVYLWNHGQNTAAEIAVEGADGIPAGWWVATDSDQRFSEDDRRLYFETAPIPDSVIEEREQAAAEQEDKHVAEQDDEDEQAKLDIWHWQDPYLQPQQLLQAEAERKRDYRAAYHFKTKRIVQLATRQIPVVDIDVRSKSNRAIAVTDMEYRKVLSWESPGYQDTYLVNLDSGKRDRVQQRVRWNARLSPSAKFIYWFDAELRKWFTQSTSSGSQPVNVTATIKQRLDDELHDRPSLPGAYGTAGWTKDDKALLVYDRFDIWLVDPTGQSPAIRLTQGRENKLRFRYQRLDAKERFIATDDAIVLSAFNEATKASGFYSLTLARDAWKNPKQKVQDRSDDSSPRQLIMLDESLSSLQKAESSDAVIFTRNTFEMCPDLWASTMDFETIDRISDVNPQQEDYVWGTAELVHWKATDGQPLDGILYRPDGFDPQKKYPMLVYFYERSSDRLHRYHTPAAGRSSINISFYVSRGYVVFVPDIPYKTGQPGASAANAILSGVDHVVAEGFIDEKRIGMQGHSWGGYQTAYLVTQTDRFACAESGAPVSNMTSAYGGIRWSSGRSRMFQYERTQSRIGDDLWTARDKYIANSPLFFADKINTPLLILHNDNDGAVPWYQGIELFVALRRLEKPAWMLNYNGNSHGVDGQPNRRDFAIRMQQFFDHYLKDAPEPEWMAVGVPAVNKGKELGLELLEPLEQVEPAE